MSLIADTPRPDTSAASFEDEVSRGARFTFGKNWQHFLTVLDDERIAGAEKSLRDMLGRERLDGRTFLDAGSGSGLFSLVARRLGARVRSFDYDPQSVACTAELRRRYFPDDANWSVGSGSVLDRTFLDSLGRFDIVYSWGVLHHTGDMWAALGNMAPLVAPAGSLFISIYNDQGTRSARWRRVKQLYCSSKVGQLAVVSVFIPYFLLMGFLADVRKRTNPLIRYRVYKRSRGMSISHDWFDWLGGYPFEVATPEAIFDFYRKHGFTLERLLTNGGGSGCNQFVFRRQP